MLGPLLNFEEFVMGQGEDGDQPLILPFERNNYRLEGPPPPGLLHFLDALSFKIPVGHLVIFNGAYW